MEISTSKKWHPTGARGAYRTVLCPIFKPQCDSVYSSACLWDRRPMEPSNQMAAASANKFLSSISRTWYWDPLYPWGLCLKSPDRCIQLLVRSLCWGFAHALPLPGMPSLFSSPQLLGWKSMRHHYRAHRTLL